LPFQRKGFSGSLQTLPGWRGRGWKR